MTPGIQPRMESRILMRKSAPQPALKNTESGGRKRAKKYKSTSDYIEELATSFLSLFVKFLFECELTVELTSPAIVFECLDCLIGVPMLVVCLRVELSAMSPSGMIDGIYSLSQPTNPNMSFAFFFRLILPWLSSRQERLTLADG